MHNEILMKETGDKLEWLVSLLIDDISLVVYSSLATGDAL
jgi:hypothetical protein